MSRRYDVIVIGAGAAGLTIAHGAAALGKKVLMIEKDLVGGDCTHYGCVPSKKLISIGKKIYEYEHYTKQKGAYSIQKILREVQSTVKLVQNWFESDEYLREKGIEVMYGAATFVDPYTIKVNDKTYRAKKIFIATGSKPNIPKIPGLEKIAYLTNETIFEPRKFESLLIIGGGVIACELASAFAMLGIHVTICTQASRLLENEDEEGVRIIHRRMKKLGVRLYTLCKIHKVSEKGKMKKVVISMGTSKKTYIVDADEILLATGRIPHFKHLGVEKLGIKTSAKGIITNGYGYTGVGKVYAIGDVASKYKYTHYANHQGRVAFVRSFLKLPINFEERVIPKVIFTSPEYAAVGIYRGQDIKKSQHLVFEYHYNRVDRAVIEGKDSGFIRCVTNKSGKMLGALIVGESAGELLGELSLAIKKKMYITDISDTIHAYPTYSVALQQCADQYRKYTFSRWKQFFKWIIWWGNKK